MPPTCHLVAIQIAAFEMVLAACSTAGSMGHRLKRDDSHTMRRAHRKVIRVRYGRIARVTLSLKRALSHVAVAVVLLLAQQAGYEHALSHFEQSSPASSQKQPPHNACIKCGLSAQLDTGLLGRAVTFVPAAGIARGTLVLSQAFYPGAPRRFLSRAPPTSV